MDHDLNHTYIPQSLKIVIYSKQPCRQSEALAATLGIDSLDNLEQIHDQYSYFLSIDQGVLCLQQTGKKAPGPISVDFTGAGSEYRRTKGGGELIIKAIGGDKKNRPVVLDVTAGLGRDSFVLASKGYPVTMIERSPIVTALLDDGLKRLSEADEPDLEQVARRLSLLKGNAIDYLKGLSSNDKPPVIYIDPMFPLSKKTALVKKEMRAFHDVVGLNEDDEQLLEYALDNVINRVVVKRPLKAEPLGKRKPQLSMKGKSVRFDIYTVKRFD